MSSIRNVLLATIITALIIAFWFLIPVLMVLGISLLVGLIVYAMVKKHYDEQ